MEKPKIIILDGPDGSGKSSVRKEIDEYIPTCFTIERFTPSVYTYAKLYERPTDLDYIHLLEINMEKTFDICPVLLECDIQLLYDRCQKGTHTFPIRYIDLCYAIEYMEHFTKKLSKLKWITITSEFLRPDQIFDIIKRRFAI